MSSDPLEPLPPKLMAVLDLERDAYPEDPVLKANVLERVELAIGLASPASAGLMLGAKKVAAIGAATLAIGFGAGIGTAHLLLPPREAHSEAAPAASVVVHVDASAMPNMPPAPPVTSAPPAPVVASATHTPLTSRPRGDLAKERELLDVARAALARGRYADALAAAELHETKWPRGYLVEEREVVFVQALAAAGRRQEAETKAERFRKRFPRSMLLPAVDATLGDP